MGGGCGCCCDGLCIGRVLALTTYGCGCVGARGCVWGQWCLLGVYIHIWACGSMWVRNSGVNAAEPGMYFPC